MVRVRRHRRERVVRYVPRLSAACSPPRPDSALLLTRSDGFIVGVLDHTLHIQVAPSSNLLHGHPPPPPTPLSPPFHGSSPTGSHRSHPPPVSSLFHVQLRMLSVFQFNEAGRIVFQRDHWDVRDLVEAVVPFAGLVGAVGRWAGGLGLRLIGRAVGGCGPEKLDRRRTQMATAAAEAAEERKATGTTTPADTADHKEADLTGLPLSSNDPTLRPSPVYRSTNLPFPSSAPMSAFPSVNTSPLSPTTHLRGLRSNAPIHVPSSSTGGETSTTTSTLTSPTLTASILATTPSRSRARRGTSSRSWGSAGRSGSVSLPGGIKVQIKSPGSGTTGLPAEPEAGVNECARGALGLMYDQAEEAVASTNNGTGERAMDHAP